MMGMLTMFDHATVRAMFGMASRPFLRMNTLTPRETAPRETPENRRAETSAPWPVRNSPE